MGVGSCAFTSWVSIYIHTYMHLCTHMYTWTQLFLCFSFQYIKAEGSNVNLGRNLGDHTHELKRKKRQKKKNWLSTVGFNGKQHGLYRRKEVVWESVGLWVLFDFLYSLTRLTTIYWFLMNIDLSVTIATNIIHSHTSLHSRIEFYFIRIAGFLLSKLFAGAGVMAPSSVGTVFATQA